MTDTKKCGTFLVKIGTLADRNRIEISRRPSDAIVLDVFHLLSPGVCDPWYFRMVSRESAVQITSWAYAPGYAGFHNVDVTIGSYRRFTTQAPHRFLKRKVWESRHYVVTVGSDRIEAFARHLAKWKDKPTYVSFDNEPRVSHDI